MALFFVQQGRIKKIRKIHTETIKAVIIIGGIADQIVPGKEVPRAKKSPKVLAKNDHY
jgi:hypothetical protein